MTVVIDISSAVHAKAGLSRYSTSLTRALRPLLGPQLELFQNSLGKLPPPPGLGAMAVCGTPMGYRPWRAAVLAAQMLGVHAAPLPRQATVFHATEHLLPPVVTPTVLTVHDLIFELFPKYHKAGNYVYLRMAMPLYCRRADLIIAVSEATRRDLIERYHVSPGKIRVIPEAAASHFAPSGPDAIEGVRNRLGLGGRYILAVGTLEPRKNIAALAKACGPLFEQGIVDSLVVVGAQGWLFQDAMRQIMSLPWHDRVLMPGYLSDQDLIALYSGALLTAQPSHYEGFGLPVLEAMACGSPVCASKTSSLPEVGGDAARYFDPEDTDSMSDTLMRVAGDERLRERMSAAGLARAAGFTWDAAARATVDVYSELCPRIEALA